jgi:hypothetical protein
MFLLLALGFVLVLFKSLEPVLEAPQQGARIDEMFTDVALGQTKMQRYQGRRVWVSRINQDIRQNMSLLNGVVAAQEKPCLEKESLCVIVAATTRDGIELVFSAQPPPQLDANVPWYGGFVNPAEGSVYDLLGRPYKVGSPALEIVGFEEAE